MRLFSKHFLLLQSGFFVFSFAGVFLKNGARYPVFSFFFLLHSAGAFLCVCFFALIWQQVLRKYELLTAYAWRGAVFLWTFLWATLFFGETLTPRNFLGTAFIMCGMLLVTARE